MPGVTRYLNTDLILASRQPLSELCREFDRECCVLHHDHEEDGLWHATIESNAPENVSAADDIRRMMATWEQLSSRAESQWKACHERCFDMGFDCGDTWAYPHELPVDVIRLLADTGCSLAVTLYPIRSVEP